MKYSEVKAYKFKLEESYSRFTGIKGYEFNTAYYSMCPDGEFVVFRGYAWDGSSIPYKKLLRIASLGFYDPDRYCKEASLIHDGLCQAIREGLLPKKWKLQADILYKKMSVEGGMSEKQAKRRYVVLRKFGDKGIEPEKNPRNKIYDTNDRGKVKYKKL